MSDPQVSSQFRNTFNLGPPHPKTRHRGALEAMVLSILLLAFAAPAARAQVIKPWTPATPDSMLRMAAEARTSFRANRGDSVTGPNFHAYEVVGRMAMRQVRSLGRNHLSEARALESMLDSLGLDTSIAWDERQPTFLLVMVHNPFQRTAPAVGFLYWHRGEELRWQGSLFRGGRSPEMRVWWTGQKAAPYRAAVIDRVLGDPEQRRLTTFALNEIGTLWSPGQYEGAGPDLSGARETAFADLNRDGRPELIVWSAATAESLFQACRECPPLLTEQTWVDRNGRFELDDSRVLPSPYSTFAVFIRLLREGNKAAASRLLATPAKVDEALREGWATGTGKGLWTVEYGEPEVGWPRWLAIRFRGNKEKPIYTVRFTQRDQRWVIETWIRQTSARSAALSDSTGRRPPGTTSK